MAPDLGALVEAWPFAASLALAARAHGRREARRRTALNEALHELRRPLQVLALGQGDAGDAGEGDRKAEVAGAPLRMATAALERMGREINGKALAPVRRRLEARPLLEAAVARWRGPAALAGDSLRLHWRAGEAVLGADEVGLAQALDNLIANAIEHGGPRIEVEARLAGGLLRIGVRDSGPRVSARPPRRRPAELVARASGRRRHGHGLRVVRRIAAEHGGRFELRRAAGSTEALLELPLLATEVAAAGAKGDRRGGEGER